MKKLQLRFSDIGAQRGFIYGFAALWIMLYHMTYKFPRSGFWMPLSHFLEFGACGVEVFLLLTGYGLYVSMNKNSIGTFYKNRALRVLLPIVLIETFNLLLHDGDFPGMMSHYNVLSYWFGGGYAWYVSFILVIYMVYPALHFLYKKDRRLIYALLALSVIAVIVMCLFFYDFYYPLRQSFTRIPIFLLGMLLIPAFEKKKTVPLWSVILALVVFLGATGMRHLDSLPEKFQYATRSFSYIGLAYFLVAVCAWIAGVLPKFGLGRFVYRFVAMCGNISLEIYMLFFNISSMLAIIPWYANPTIDDHMQASFLGCALTILLSLLIKAFTDYIIKEFRGIRIPERKE